MKRFYLALCLPVLVLTVAQLSLGGKPPAVDPGAGKTLYQQKGCVPCHGATGKGDGPAANALNPKPTNFTDPKVMSKLKDADLFKAIKLGGKAVGKAATMPGYADQMSDAEIRNVVAHLRTLSKPGRK